jgi:RNA-directed DNA polymerase
VDELKASGKPFQISKQEVWGAWLKVKGNRGAPGADGQSIGEYEKDLKGNLYKIWNRMSSGTYFPPPVMAVEIAKPHGAGTRVLGVPTEPANRPVAQGSRGSGIVCHGDAPVPPAVRAAAAGAV